jgi:hypothetical protein
MIISCTPKIIDVTTKSITTKERPKLIIAGMPHQQQQQQQQQR